MRGRGRGPMRERGRGQMRGRGRGRRDLFEYNEGKSRDMIGNYNTFQNDGFNMNLCMNNDLNICNYGRPSKDDSDSQDSGADEELNCIESIIDKDEYQKGSKMEDKKQDEKKEINFSLNELVLTQDIFDGFWDLNPQINLLIEKEKKVYEKIEEIMKERNINDRRIKITLLVLYYFRANNSFNKIEYSLIIKKGTKFLENNGVNYKDILSHI